MQFEKIIKLYNTLQKSVLMIIIIEMNFLSSLTTRRREKCRRQR